MFVKKSLVERWYKSDSWVYKNFSYLFQNPLWEKDVPNGFSVCPYFWLSLFSLFIFKPFVVFPTKYAILPIIKLIGWPAKAFDQACHNFAFKIGITDRKYHLGSGIFLFVISLASLFVAVVLLSIAGHLICYNYAFITSTPLGMLVFWSIASFLFLFGIIAAHKAITKTECKSLYYLFIWLALFIAATIKFIPQQLLALIKVTWSELGIIFKDFGIGIWFALKYLGIGIWYGVSFTPIHSLHISWLVYLLAFGIVVWIQDIIMTKMDNKKREQLKIETTDEEIMKLNRSAWIKLFIKILKSKDYWKDGDFFYNENGSCFSYDENIFQDYFVAMAAKDCRDKIYIEAFESLFSKTLNKLQKKYPVLNYKKFEELLKCGYFDEYIFNHLNSTLDIKIKALDFSSVDFKKSIVEVMQSTEIKNDIDHLSAQLRADVKRIEEKKSHKGWTHEACLKITGKIAHTVKVIVMGFLALFALILTFLSYIWMLIKAKKQGACPYFKFEKVRTLKDK